MRGVQKMCQKSVVAPLAMIGICIALSACGGGGGGGGGSGSADTAKPAVVASTAPDGTTNIDPNATLSLAFSEEVHPATVNGLSIVLLQPAGPVAGAVTASGATATLRQTRPLALKTRHTLIATAGVRDFAGNPLTAFSTSFTTRDGAWSNPQLIEGNNAGSASVPQVAMDANGNAVAVWQQLDGTRFNIWANQYRARVGGNPGFWGNPERIEIDDAGDAVNPQVAVDSSGNAIAVWQQSNGVTVNIWANRHSNGTWGGAQLIESTDNGGATNPRIAMNAAGNATVVWFQFDGARADIWANRTIVGSGWGVAQMIESELTNSAVNPDVAVAANGDAIAVWQQTDGPRDNIWANRFGDGNWGTAAPIEVDNNGFARNPRIAVDTSGNALAVWFQSDGTRTNIWANRYQAGGTWGSAELIETDDTGDAEYPRVAFDGSGNAIAVWHQSDGTWLDIRSNRYVAGAGWGTPQSIEAGNLGDAKFPRVAVDGNGNAIAVWQESDGIHTNVRANRYVAGTGWGTAQLIETTDAGPAIDPQIAIDAGGYGIAVWTQSDGARYNINAVRFE